MPEKLSEEEFWTRFFQSQLLHQQDREGTFVDAMSEGMSSLQQQQPCPLVSSADLNATETAGSILGDDVSEGRCDRGSGLEIMSVVAY